MALIDIFKTKPRWLHSDPSVRVEAVRDIDVGDRTLLTTIAKTDLDARVRRSAVKKLKDVPVLIDIAAVDADESVREEARTALLAATLEGGEPALCEAALAGLTDQRLLTTVAKTARLDTVRAGALERITDPRTIAGIAREAESSATRLAALARLEDATLILSVAMGSEHKDAALAALERVQDRDTLKTVAGRARTKAAQRRARALLGTQAGSGALSPHERRSRQIRLCQRLEDLLHVHDWQNADSTLAAVKAEWEELAPAVDEILMARFSTSQKAVTAGYERYREERLEDERVRAERLQAITARVAICEKVEAVTGDDCAAQIKEARAAWAALPPFDGAEAEALSSRFDRACQAAHDRAPAEPVASDSRQHAARLAEEAGRLAAQQDLIQARRRFVALEREWAGIDAALDTDAAASFEKARRLLADRETAAREERETHERQSVARVEKICSQLEQLLQAEAPDLREAERSLRESKLALDSIGQLPSRKDRESLAARLERARRRLYPRVQELRQDAEWKRWVNVDVQERLCERAQALLDVEDMEKVARELREIDAEWRQAREVPREQSAALRERFQQAREQLRIRCDAYFARLAQERAGNIKKKEELCERAQALAQSSDWIKTTTEIRRLQAEWKKIGPVPSKVDRALWSRFHAPCDCFFSRLKEHRAQQVAEWNENLRKKEELCERAQALATSTDWDQAAAEIRQVQVEWKSVGAVRRSRSESVWQRFRGACDAFFERYKNRNALDQESNLARRESLLKELEELSVSRADLPAPEISQRVVEIQTAWRQCGYLPRDVAQPLEERFAQARCAIVLAYPGSFAGTDLDPEASRRKKEKLCSRIETLVEELAPEIAEGDIARQIRSALAANAMGSRSDREARWRAAVPEVENAQASWRRLGPIVPQETEQGLKERFERACARFLELKPKGTRA